MLVGESVTWSDTIGALSSMRYEILRKKDGIPGQAYRFWFRNKGSSPISLQYGNGVLCDPITIDPVGGDNKYDVPGGAITHFVVIGGDGDDVAWEAGAVVR